METSVKTELACKGTEDVENNIQSSKNLNDEEKSESNEKSSQNMFSCPGTLSGDENQKQEKLLFQESPNLDIKDKSVKEIDDKRLCEPCISGNLQVQATHFCKTCDDPELLCDTCAKHHTKQRAYKHHELSIDIRDFQESVMEMDDKRLCEPCISGNLKVQATHFCKTCDDPELLCDTCAKHHTKQRAYKHHELSNDIRDFQKSVMEMDDKRHCEPCSSENLQVQATHFCKTCDDPELLCDTCAKHHTKQKAYKHHELSNDIRHFQNSAEKTDERKLCELCSFENLQVQATHFCKTCGDPELLCDTCAKHHTKQKAFKYHELSKDIRHFKKSAEKIEERKLCEPCSSENMQVQATQFCKTCDDPELLCDTCARHHTKQKAYKHHELSKDIRDFQRSAEKIEERKLCEPCFSENMQVQAVHFCKTCDDPELLCDTCAKYHIKQKAYKHHELTNDLGDFQKSVEKLDERKLCESCFSENLQVQAAHFCKTCDDPELLCDTCAKQHTKQKPFKHHELSNNIGDFQKREEIHLEKLCELCFSENMQVQATRFCKTCDDPDLLCEICAKQHTKQKPFKHHELSNNIEDFQKSEKGINKRNVCEPCFSENRQVQATTFCKTCDDPDPLCETCAKYHTKQKPFKYHELSKDIGDFQKRQNETLLSSNRKYLRFAKTPMKSVEDEKTPGKPASMEIKSNSLKLIWEKSVENVTYYQVRYKCSNKEDKWKFIETDSSQNFLVITGLMATTEYMFQVRGVFGDLEGPYSPVSEIIATKESLATQILGFCELMKQGDPSIYLLPAEENIKARNENARTKQLIFGKAPPVLHEKTILLVGATGSGKSTLVDGFVNYIMGVSFDDPFRFTTIKLENEEKKTHNQAVSQTEWITVYKLHPKPGSRLNYTLNIIDTPGFGDTRGIQRDNEIVDQIRQLFCSQGDDGVSYIDAVCFIVKAPDARLTVIQKYIFSSIMALFGKDIESNICTLITFADGAEPPVLASLKESKLPYNKTFNFNNSALFTGNVELANNTLPPMFWEMGCKSLERFFKHIKDLKTASLSQTKNVLEEREQLKCVISNIQPQITMGLSKLSELRQKVEIFQRNKSEIENNQNFEYTVEVPKQKLIELKPGKHVTNCLHCNVTCHEDCGIPDDDQKKRCLAMDKDGNCRICPENCFWTEHKNTPYVIECVIEKVTKTYAEMKDKYEEAIGQKITHEKYIEDLTYCVDNTFEEINRMMNEMNRCKSKLKEIALRPDPLSAVEHIDLLIKSEQEEKQPGYENRIKMLKEFRKSAVLDQEVEKFGKHIQNARENTKSVTGKSFGRANEKKETKTYLSRGYQYLKNLF